MALGHVYRSNHTTQISVAKIKSARVLAAAGRHNMRDKARLGKKEANHIDLARTHLNQTIRQNASGNLYCEILSKVTGKEVTPKMAKKIDPYDLHYADGKKVRMGRKAGTKSQDAVLAFEVEASYPGDLIWCELDSKTKQPRMVDKDVVIDEETLKHNDYFLYPKDMNEFEKWKLRTVAFFEKNYGEDNVMSVEVHMDETIPHLHALCSAVYKDKDGVNRLSYRKVSDGLEGRLHSYRALQTEYAKQFEDMGYNRGVEESIRNTTYNAPARKRALMSKILEATLPKDPTEAENLYQAALAKNAALEAEIEPVRTAAKSIERQKQDIRKLKEENRELQDQLAAKNEEIAKLQRIARRVDYEERGRQLAEDKEVADSVYPKIKSMFINAGIEEAKRLGLYHEEEPELEHNETPVEHE